MSQTKPVNFSTFVAGNNAILLVSKYYNCCASNHFSEIAIDNKTISFEIFSGIWESICLI